MNHKNLVIIESPFAGETQDEINANIEYARLCVKDSLQRGEAPIASHLLYTQNGILDDTVPEQRKLGIEAGLAWLCMADISAVYIDRGMSSGMEQGIEAARVKGVIVELRRLDGYRAN
jgi:hypothetical protein